MNIYIFETYEWKYCGGMCVVIARDGTRALQLIKQELIE